MISTASRGLRRIGPLALIALALTLAGCAEFITDLQNSGSDPNYVAPKDEDIIMEPEPEPPAPPQLPQAPAPVVPDELHVLTLSYAHFTAQGYSEIYAEITGTIGEGLFARLTGGETQNASATVGVDGKAHFTFHITQPGRYRVEIRLLPTDSVATAVDSITVDPPE